MKKKAPPPPPRLTAYAWANGVIQFTKGRAPKGAIAFLSGAPKQVRDTVLLLAPTKEVPGISHAKALGKDPVQILIEFTNRAAACYKDEVDPVRAVKELAAELMATDLRGAAFAALSRRFSRATTVLKAAARKRARSTP